MAKKKSKKRADQAADATVGEDTVHRAPSTDQTTATTDLTPASPSPSQGGGLPMTGDAAGPPPTDRDVLPHRAPPREGEREQGSARSAVPAPAADTRCGFVAIIGPTNAGKSTLVNALVGTKVTIVSHKVQTTRNLIRGIAIAGKSQIVLVDTPGIFTPRRRLDRAMVDAAWGGASDGDVTVLLLDAVKGLDADAERILTRLSDTAGRRILALNKIDKVDKSALLALTAALNQRLAFAATFMISALDGSGVADLKRHLAEAVPEGPWHYPEDEVSDLPMRMLASEITREKIYKYLHQELPYAITVETTQWTDFKNGAARIEQTIYVERDSQKSIVLGAKGATIKQISSEARAEIAAIIERKAHLFLFVKVRQGWGDDPERYREIGLDFPRD